MVVGVNIILNLFLTLDEAETEAEAGKRRADTSNGEKPRDNTPVIKPSPVTPNKPNQVCTSTLLCKLPLICYRFKSVTSSVTHQSPLLTRAASIHTSKKMY